MYNFTITENRHKGRYGFRTENFPDSYYVYESTLNYKNDPDWTVKMKPKRFRGKRLLFILICAYLGLRWRRNMVEEVDRQKRREQRSMQNNDLEDYYLKEVRFVLYDKDNKEFNEGNLKNNQNEYTVFWFDAKMRNYIAFIEYLNKKPMVAARINPVLIV